MKFLVAVAMTFLSQSVSAAVPLVLEGKSDYVCFVMGESPLERGKYDQVFFAGEVLNEGGNTQVIAIKASMQVVRAADYGRLVTGIFSWAALDRAIVLSVFLTPANEVDAKRSLVISIGRVALSNPLMPLIVTSMAGGYHKGAVVLMDRSQNLSINCYHKTILATPSATPSTTLPLPQ